MRQLQITPLDGYDPGIGRWLWALQDVRRRYTLRLVSDLDERLVDWEGPDGQENAIGSLLYHIGHVEMGWLYGDVKQMAELPPVKQDFPFPGWEQGRNRLTRVLGVPLAEHIGRRTAAAKPSSGNSRACRPTTGAGCAALMTSRKSITKLHPSGPCSTLSSMRQAMPFRSAR